MSYELICGDAIEVMRAMADKSVDCVVTDPPYGLSFMGKHWDYGVPGVAFWEAALRVAKPGAMLLAFGGTRTHHRLMVAIEDAGWEIRDCLMWVFGSGFPKNRNALKPAWEPIIMARKPLQGTVADNVLAWGTGGINVDGCRIPTNGDALVRPAIARDDNHAFGKGLGVGVQIEPQGRWPANLLLDEEAAAMLDEMSGVSKSPNKPIMGIQKRRHDTGSPGKGVERDVPGVGYGDTGGASRFFYVAKASKRDRDEGLEGMPEHVTAAYGNETIEGAARRGRQPRHAGTIANHHPTVKPTQLMRYLVRLVTPRYGVILDPFMGSGSTGKAAILEGFSFIGIDTDADYLEIARRRIEYAAAQPLLLEVA